MARALSVAKRRTNTRRKTTTRRRTNGTKAGQRRKTARRAYATKRRTNSVAKRRTNTAARRTNAAKQLSNMKARANRVAANAAAGGEALGHVVATQGALMATAAATGMYGSQKMKLGGKDYGDLRLLVGGGLTAAGVASAFRGKKKAAMMGGKTALAVGNGVLGAYLYEVAYNFGIDQAAKKGNVTLSAPGTPYPSGRSRIQGEFGREVYVTPSTAGRAGLGYRG
jgi:hypothetical protein